MRRKSGHQMKLVLGLRNPQKGLRFIEVVISIVVIAVLMLASYAQMTQAAADPGTVGLVKTSQADFEAAGSVSRNRGPHHVSFPSDKNRRIRGRKRNY